jgi:hypothetical protein
MSNTNINPRHKRSFAHAHIPLVSIFGLPEKIRFPPVYPLCSASVQRFPNTRSRLKQRPKITTPPQSPQNKGKEAVNSTKTPLTVAYLRHELEKLIRRISHFHRTENLGIPCTNKVLEPCLRSSI